MFLFWYPPFTGCPSNGTCPKHPLQINDFVTWLREKHSTKIEATKDDGGQQHLRSWSGGRFWRGWNSMVCCSQFALDSTSSHTSWGSVFAICFWGPCKYLFMRCLGLGFSDIEGGHASQFLFFNFAEYDLVVMRECGWHEGLMWLMPLQFFTTRSGGKWKSPSGSRPLHVHSPGAYCYKEGNISIAISKWSQRVSCISAIHEVIKTYSPQGALRPPFWGTRFHRS